MGTQPRNGFVRVEPQKRDREPVIEGAELVAELPAPTVEQMENLAAALGFAPLLTMRSLPNYEAALRNLHALVQAALNGDIEAERRLQLMRGVVSRGAEPTESASTAVEGFGETGQ